MANRRVTGEREGRPRTPRQRRLLILFALVVLDVFALGGLVALVLVNRLLGQQLATYVSHNMDAASTILDLMDDLIPYYGAYGGAVLALLLITCCVWAWLVTDSRLLRYGGALLVLAVVVVGAWILASRSTEGPTVPSSTPTPLASSPGAVGAYLSDLGVLSREPWRPLSVDAVQV
jgi:uncharacterized BrkB/YihY/UPF0761 family membrane protein